MIAAVLRLAWRALTSRIGLAVILGAVLWGWHVLDKGQALEAARDGYVLQVELASVQVALAEQQRRAAVAGDARRVLEEKMQASTGEALRFAAELEAFKNETGINPDCVVDDSFLQRMRAN